MNPIVIKTAATRGVGALCPQCGEGLQLYSSLLSMVGADETGRPVIHEAHELGVCAECYRSQRLGLYGEEDPPWSPS